MVFWQDCFSRGLLREALGQLAGLKRRKLALEMLGSAVQSGLNKKDAELKQKEGSNKRASKDNSAEPEPKKIKTT